MQLFTRHQRRVYLFILSQIPDPAEAEEVLQETNVVILRKFGRFEAGTNFLAWACSIARFEVLKYYDRHKRDRVHFSTEFIRLVEGETVRREELTDARRIALAKCLNGLGEDDRRLIELRYKPGNTGRSVAGQIGRPSNSVYQSLGRIRRALLDCINRRVAAQGY